MFYMAWRIIGYVSNSWNNLKETRTDAGVSRTMEPALWRAGPQARNPSVLPSLPFLSSLSSSPFLPFLTLFIRFPSPSSSLLKFQPWNLGTARYAAAIVFGLKFADNVHCKFKSSYASLKPGFKSYKHTGAKQNLMQNDHTRSRVSESMEKR